MSGVDLYRASGAGGVHPGSIEWLIVPERSIPPPGVRFRRGIPGSRATRPPSPRRESERPRDCYSAGSVLPQFSLYVGMVPLSWDQSGVFWVGISHFVLSTPQVNTCKSQ